MNLIDRYVSEVGRRLPRHMRADIETELRSTLQDMLEDRAQAGGRPVSEEMTLALLKEYGPPDQVAAAYLPERYLIGPRLYPLYVLVLKIVLAVIAALAAAGLLIALTQTQPQAVLNLLAGRALDLIAALILIFGNVTLVFAVLERTLPASGFESSAEDWDPAQLSAGPDPDQVSLAGPVFGIIFIAAALIVLNFFPQFIAIRLLQDGERVVFPLLSETFYRFLPWITVGGLLELVLNIVLLRTGAWSRFTRLLQIGVDLLAVGIVLAVLRSPSLIVPVDSLRGQTPDIVVVILAQLHWLVPVGLGVVILVCLIEIFEQARSLLRSPRPHQPFLPQ